MGAFSTIGMLNRRATFLLRQALDSLHIAIAYTLLWLILAIFPDGVSVRTYRFIYIKYIETNPNSTDTLHKRSLVARAFKELKLQKES